MKHIVQFSGGAASTYVGWLVVNEFGAENTILLNHDTGAEHIDTKRFLQQTSDYIGVPITHVNSERDLWQLIEDKMCLPSYFMPFCTHILKIEPAEKFLQKINEPYILYNGLGLEEMNRVQRSILRGAVLGRTVRSLLAERHISNDSVKRTIRDEWQICLPEPYLYLSHNNCIPCFKAGKGHFFKVWQNYPQAFIKVLQMEELVGHTVFKDISMKELAARWAEQEINEELFDGRPCICAS